MTLSVKHAYTTSKVDGPDTTVVRPSNWNEEHAITVGGRSLVGKTSTGTGPAEQIDISAAILAFLQTADIDAACAALGLTRPTTGDAKFTMKSTADTGWILLTEDGSIGSATSGSTVRANVDTEALYTLIWENVSNTDAPVHLANTSTPTTRGISAAADFGSNKPLMIPKMVGRAMAFAGQGIDLTDRALGVAVGAETHALATAELALHTHTGTTGTESVGHTHTGSGNTGDQSQSHVHSGNTGAGAGTNHDHNITTAASLDVGVETGGTGGFWWGAATTATGAENQNLGHTHPFTTGAASNGHVHAYAFTTSGASATHTHSITTNSAGSGTAHNNMQPTTFAFRVMIKL